MFVGEKGVKHRRDAELEQAKKMLEEQRASNETIFKDTGWFLGLDGKWRTELDDSSLEFSDEFMRMILRAPKEPMDVEEITLTYAGGDKYAIEFYGSGDIDYCLIENVHRDDLKHFFSDSPDLLDIEALNLPTDEWEEITINPSPFYFSGIPKSLPTPLCFKNGYIQFDIPELYSSYVSMETRLGTTPFITSDSESTGKLMGSMETEGGDGSTMHTLRIYGHEHTSVSEIKSTVLHETQHTIQHICDLSKGSNKNLFNAADLNYFSAVQNRIKQKEQIQQNPLIEKLLVERELYIQTLRDKYTDEEGIFQLSNAPDDELYDVIIPTLHQNEDDLYDAGYDRRLMTESNSDIGLIKESGYTLYRETYGEKEARATEERLHLTADERSKHLPTCLTELTSIPTAFIPQGAYSAVKFHNEQKQLFTEPLPSVDTSPLYDDFSTINLPANANSRTVVESLIYSTMEMYGNLYQDLPDGNKLKSEFNELAAFAGINPDDWTKMDYFYRNKASEKIALAFVEHCHDKTRFAGLAKFFEKLTDAMKSLISSTRPDMRKGDVTPESVKQVFDSMLLEAHADQNGYQLSFHQKLLAKSTIPVSESLTLGAFAENMMRHISEKSGIEFTELTTRFNIEIKGQPRRPKQPEFFKVRN